MRELYGKCLILLLVAVVASCSSAPRSFKPPVRFNSPIISDEALVWRGARISVPVRGTAGSMITTNGAGMNLLQLAGASPNTRWPVIILLEGCFQKSPPRLLRALAEQGYVAISLASDQRQQMLSKCDVGRNGAAASDDLRSQKRAELSYAMAALQKTDWANLENVFVLGQEEGADVALMTSSERLRGRILVNWHCEAGRLIYPDPKIESPLFAVFIASTDEQRHRINACEQQLRRNENNQSITLNQAYPLHVLLEPIAFTQLLQFLDRQLFR
jgi:dienelactone hydrolase